MASLKDMFNSSESEGEGNATHTEKPTEKRSGEVEVEEVVTFGSGSEAFVPGDTPSVKWLYLQVSKGKPAIPLKVEKEKLNAMIP